MAQTELEKLGITVKKNGKIDFDKPPKGKIYVPFLTSEEDMSTSGYMIRSWHTSR